MKLIGNINTESLVLALSEPTPPDPEEISTHVLEPIIEIGKEEIVVPEGPAIEMTRKQLYDEIWEISVAGVARKYDIPYTQLMKQIKEAAIPIPPSGYWTKLSYGKPVIKIELTESADAILSIYKAAPNVRENKRKIKKARKEESKPLRDEQVSTSSDKPNPTEMIAAQIPTAVTAPEFVLQSFLSD